MADIGELSVQISAQMADFTSAMQDAISQVNDFSSAMKDASGAASDAGEKVGKKIKSGADEAGSALKDLQETIHHVIEVLGLMEAVHIGKEIVSGALEAGEQLHLLSVQTGISTSNLQSLQFAAAS